VGWLVRQHPAERVNRALLLEREICRITDTPCRQPDMTASRLREILPRCGMYTPGVMYMHTGSLLNAVTEQGFTFKPDGGWCKVMTDPMDGRAIVCMHRVWDNL